MANEAVLKFPQNHCNRKVTPIFQWNTVISKYPSESHYHEIWVNSLPCKLVLENFMPEFNSGSHEAKKMSTRWFLKPDVKFCHGHQSRGCFRYIIGHQILLNLITAKQGKANFNRQFKCRNSASPSFFHIKCHPGRKEAPCWSRSFTCYPQLWETESSNSASFWAQRSVFKTPPHTFPFSLLPTEQTCLASHSLKHRSVLISLPFYRSL